MSDFKFACPVCGQHITCDSSSSGSQMECPTCFRKLIIPQRPSETSSNLILTAALVGSQRPGAAAAPESVATPAPKTFPYTTAALIGLLCAVLAAAVVFRDKIFKPSARAIVTQTNSPVEPPLTNLPVAIRPANDTNWMLELSAMKIPDSPASGWIAGRKFDVLRAAVQGGTLTLRRGSKDPEDLRVVIQLFAKQGEDLANQSVNIETNRDKPPRVSFRWKDEQQQPAKREIHSGYALRIEFGPAAGGRLPGRIYLCAPDDEKSWVAGRFDAEIRKPAPPKSPKSPKTNAPAFPKR